MGVLPEPVHGVLERSERFIRGSGGIVLNLESDRGRSHFGLNQYEGYDCLMILHQPVVVTVMWEKSRQNKEKSRHRPVEFYQVSIVSRLLP